MKQFSITFLFLLTILSFIQKEPIIIRNDFKTYYDSFQVDGSFVLYNQNAHSYTFYNKPQYTESFSPASTFKICNSLIGIETGVIKDADFVIPWDSVTRSYPVWNQDQTFRMAFQNSTVWYYQELARRVGENQMNHWLKKSNYGNADTSGGIDLFWLTGGLRVTPKQQIDFLRRLHDHKLPFSKRTMDIVTDIMVAEKKDTYVLRAKTGWSDESNRHVGWYVGYVEKDNNVFYFATCIQTRGLDDRYIGVARKAITFNILDALEIIKK
ncbi:class D beta-lactamase [uncultured Cytophaga sp.]|uniref:class D beta-lactamase n=1 Tax=uncultured Cytophaga sp. TaxID=160238 RepID=UPI002633EB1E|nr:class D beta-lactamase [uncultured Cytophaga sp.]